MEGFRNTTVGEKMMQSLDLYMDMSSLYKLVLDSSPILCFVLCSRPGCDSETVP